MWSREERLLLDAIDESSLTGNWQQMLDLSDRLLCLVGHDQRKTAYVLGCKKAVALGHLKPYDEAKAVFDKAFQQAEALSEQAIAAYILNDSANIMEPVLAYVAVTRAIEMVQAIERTPDAARHLLADQAYFRANLGRIQGYMNDHTARANLVNGRQDLERFAYGFFPRYKTAYLVALGWELQFYKTARGMHWAYLWQLGRICLEAYRQGRVGVLLLRYFKRNATDKRG